MNTFVLACGSMRFTPEEEAFFGAILITVIVLWLVSAIMAFVSFCFLLNPRLSDTFKVIHGSFLAGCILVVLSPFVRMWINDIWTAGFVILGIPVFIISQFVFLMVMKRKLRRASKSLAAVADDGS